VALRRRFARWLVRRILRPGIAPGRSPARRRRHVERTAHLLPLPRGVRSAPAGDENPGGEWWLPAGVAPDTRRGAVMYIHGGGFMLGSPASHRGIAARLAHLTRLPVLAAHYRLAPEHTYPAGLEDLQSAWRRITLGVARPVALAGDSAGGWLALALALHAAAAGLPRPTGMALFSPLVDLPGAEHISPAASDLMLPPGFVAESVDAWRGDIPASDPRFDLLGASLADLPPLFVSYDRDEMLAGDARRLVQAAQTAGAQLRVEEGCGLWHAWPLLAGLLPEADVTLRNAAAMLAPGALPGRTA